ncbi:MAG: PilT protein [Tardiphaga sp.]|jgi:predicted nucleic acid-binding protein|nr:PilT protein [Tardiphaga sp.]
MRFVLDASVAASWCFDDENERVADLAFDLLEAGNVAVAPLQFWFEVRNVVLVGLRRNRLTPEGMVAQLSRIDHATIAFDPLPDSERVLTLARRHRLSFYDAAYLELAQREGIALATLDQALARAATAEAVPLIGA